MPNVLDRVAEIGVVPVIAIDSVSHALPLADALLAGGLPVAEITFRTDAAAEVIRLLSRERPDLIVGAGTVLSPETMKTAHAAGAKFAVAPGLNPRVAQAAQELGMPFVPGIANPSDIEAGLDLGCRLLKFFPAEALGGVKLPWSDKVEGARPWAIRARNGKVKLVRGPWNRSFIRTASGFPDVKHDDEIDTVSGGNHMIADGAVGTRKPVVSAPIVVNAEELFV